MAGMRQNGHRVLSYTYSAYQCLELILATDRARYFEPLLVPIL